MADSSVCFGIIGGSGLMKSKLPMFTDMSREEVHTPSGSVLLRKATLPSGATLVFVQRHKASPSESYAQPSDINFAAIAQALQGAVSQRRPLLAFSGLNRFVSWRDLGL